MRARKPSFRSMIVLSKGEKIRHGAPGFPTNMCMSIGFLVLFSILSPGMGTGSGSCVPCHSLCTCSVISGTTNECEVNCRNNSFTNISMSDLPNGSWIIVKLDFSHNNFRCLNLSGYKHLRRLEYMDMSYNVIEEVVNLSVLTNLQELYLQGNKISHINSGTLNIKSLLTIDLSSNPISEFTSDFFPASIKLKNMNISNLLLKSIASDFLQPLEKLEILDLSHNQLQSLSSGYFSSCKELQILDLSYNKLSHIAKDTFKKQKDLLHLNMSRNSISDLNDTSLNELKKLKQLDISNNQLASLQPSIISQMDDLETLSLAGNPWNCSCDLKDLSDFLVQIENRGVQLVNRSNIVCTDNPDSTFLDFPVQMEFWCPDSYGSCFYDTEEQKRFPVTFKYSFSGTDVQNCTESCFDTNSTHAVLSSNYCLCGTLLSNYNCYCDSKPYKTNDTLQCVSTTSSSFFNKIYVDSAFEVLSGLTFNPIYNVTAGVSHIFTAKVTLRTVTQFVWSFDDRTAEIKRTATGQQYTISHTYAVPGRYSLTVGIYSTNLGYGHATVPVDVCPSSSLVGTTVSCLPSNINYETVASSNVALDITLAHKLQYSWSRTPDDAVLSGKDGDCGNDWLMFRGRCLFHKTSTKNYNDAVTDCGTNLLTIHFQAEFTEIIALYSSAGQILLDAKKNDSHYVWSNGRKAYFKVSETTNASLGDCVYIDIPTSTIKGTNCSTTHEYVCQKETEMCPYGGHFYSGNSHCYTVVPTMYSWPNASAACTSIHSTAHLAKVNSNSLMSFITGNYSSVSEAWVGLNDRNLNDYPQWIDGSGLDGYPGTLNTSTGDCGSLSSSGVWTFKSCKTSLPSVCEYTILGEVSLPTYLAGKPDLSGTSYTLTSKAITTTKPADTLVIANILPGMWISQDGELRAWNFKTANLSSDVSLALEVYEPQCSTGTSFLTPGCNGSGARFGTCSTVASCPDRTSCSDNQDFCYITNNCQPKMDPCNCNNITSTMCSSDFKSNSPSYRLRGQAFVTLPKGSSQLYSVKVENMPVKKHYILAFKTNVSFDVIQWDSSNVWKDSTYQIMLSKWMSSGDTLNKTGGYWKSNTAYYIQAIYVEKEVQTLPTSLRYFTSPDNYQYTAEVPSLSLTTSCNLIAEEEAGTIEWIHPPIQSVSATEYIYLIHNESVILTFSISKGTKLTVDWQIGSQAIQGNFQNSCPATVAPMYPLKCNASEYWPEKPFTFKERAFNYNAGATSTISLTVRNDLQSQSTKQISVLIFMNLTGLAINLTTPNANNMVEIGVNTEFTVSMTTGSANTFEYSINGSLTSTLSTNTFQYNFTAKEVYLVAVNASDLMFTGTANITVIARYRAYVSNLQFVTFAPVLLINQLHTFIAQATVNTGAVIDIVWSYGPSTKTSSQTTSSTVLPLSETYNYTSAGNYTVSLTIVDEFNDTVSVNEMVEIVEAIPLVTLSASTTLSKKDDSIDFTATVPAPSSSYGKISYSFDFNDGTDKYNTTQNQVSHQFLSAGIYNVTVEASNGPSAKQSSIVLEVQEMISGLVINGDDIIVNNVTETFSVTKTTGTNLKYKFTVEGTSISQSASSNNNFTVSFPNVGNFKIIAEVTNDIDSQTSTIEVQVVTIDTLQILNLTFDEYQAVFQSVPFHIDVLHHDLKSLTVTWSFGNISVTKGVSLFNTSTSFSVADNYTIKVQVEDSNHVQNETSSMIVIVEEVSGVSITDNGPGAINNTMNFTVNANAVATAGTRLKHIWTISGQTYNTGSTSSISKVFSESGSQQLCVNVTNEVSSQYVCQTLDIYAMIENLKLVCTSCVQDSYAKDSTALIFIASITQGTTVTYSFNFGDNSTAVAGTRNSRTHTYSAGNYTLYITASNPVHSVKIGFQIAVQSSITSVDFPSSMSTLGFVNASFTLTVNVNGGSDYRFSWKYCDTCSELSSSSNVVTNPGYSVKGIYTVTVIVSNVISSASQTANLTVVEPITSVSITSNILNGQFGVKGQSYVFSPHPNTDYPNTLIKWSSRYNGGSYGAETQIWNYTNSFNQVGQYTLKCFATNILSNATSTKDIHVQETISGISITGNVTNAMGTDEGIHLQSTASQGSDLQYEWSVEYSGTTSILSSTVNTLDYSSAVNGDYRFYVNVSNDVSWSRGTFNIKIMETIDNIDITNNIGSTSPYVGKDVSVTYTAVVGKGESYNVTWEVISSGTTLTTVTGGDLTYAFTASGTYVIKMTVANQVSTKSKEFTVYVQVPVTTLSLTAGKTIAKSNENINFTAVPNTDATHAQYLWYIDGVQTSSSGISLSHAFPSSGTFTIRVTVHNNISNKTTSTAIIVQHEIQNLAFVGCDATVVENTVVTVNITMSAGTNVSFYWHSSNSVTQTGSMFSTIFTSTGKYSLTVNASNLVGSQELTCTMTTIGVISDVDIVVNSPPSWYYVNHTITFIISGKNLVGVTYIMNFTGPVNNSKVSTTNMLSNVFTAEGHYTASLTVFNAISTQTKNVSIVIETLTCTSPTVTAAGLQSRAIYKASPITFESKVALNGCTDYPIKYQWTVHSNLCSNSQVLLSTEIYTTSTKFNIPGQTLDYGNYCVQFYAEFEGTPLSNTVTFTLVVIESNLNAIIEGGSTVVRPVNQNVVINGHLSYDPDNKNANLTYQWNCSVSPAASSSGCDDILASSLSTSSVTMPSSKLQQGQIYTVTLAIPMTSRISTVAEQVIHINTASTPIVTIICVSCSAKKDYNLKPEQEVMLLGNCTNCVQNTTIAYQWTATLDTHNFDLTSTTDTTNQKKNLVVKEGQLTSASTYSFRLTVTVTTGGSSFTGYSEQTFAGYSAPTLGTCTLDRTNIKPLEDYVNFDCSGFTNPNGASTELYYRVMAYSTDSASSTESIVLYYGSSSQSGFYVGPWPGISRSTVIVKIFVENSNCATVKGFEGTIHISSPTYSGTKTDYIMGKVNTTLKDLVLEQDPTKLLQYGIVLMHEINEEARKAALLSNDVELSARSWMRNTVLLSCYYLQLMFVYDYQQVAYIMMKNMIYPKEFQTRESQLITLYKIDDFRAIMSPTQGVDVNGRLTELLLGSVSYLQNAVNMAVYTTQSVTTSDIELTTYQKITYLPPNSNYIQSGSTLSVEAHRKLIVTTTYTISVEIVVINLQNQIIGQQPITMTMDNLEIYAVRDTVATLQGSYTAIGTGFVMPDAALTGIVSSLSEILQVTIIMETNIFTFGLDNNYLSPTKTLSLLFKHPNAAAVTVGNLASSQNIKVYFPSSQITNYTTIDKAGLSSSQGYDPLLGMDFSYLVIKKSSKKKAILNFPSTVSSGYSLHIMFRIELIMDSKTASPTNKTQFYLGEGYEASATTYEQKLEVSTSDMASGISHTKYTMFVQPSQFNPSASYSVTIENTDPNFSYNISVGIYHGICQYYDETSGMWETSGTYATEESTASYTVCETNHLTTFGGRMLVPPSSIVFSDLLNLDLSTNPVVIITCSVIFAVYLVAVFVCRKLDSIDLERIATVPLCGKDGSFKYEVTVVTGRQRGSGTTAHVGVKLFGDYGKSNIRQLSKVGAFKRNCQDSFIIAHDTNLGNIQKLLIWHDNYGLDPSWYLVHVVVRDMQTEKKYYFLANFWMSLEMNNGFLQKELRAAGSAEITKFSRLFGNAVSNCMSDRHLWVSVMDRPAHSRFTRVQRATLCVTLLYTFMGVNAMWYGILKSSNDTTLSEGWASFGWEEVVLALICNVVVLPVSIFLSFVFKRSRSKTNVFEHGRRANTAESIEIDNDLSQYGGSLSTSTRDDMSCLDRESTTDSFMHENRASQPIRRTKTLKTTRATVNDTAVKTPLDSAISSDKTNGKLKRTNNPRIWNQDTLMDSWPDKHLYSHGNLDTSQSKKNNTARKEQVHEAADELMSYLDSVEQESMSIEAAALSQNRQAKPLTRKHTGHPGRGWSDIDDIMQSDTDMKSHKDKPVRRKVSTSTIGSGGKPTSSQSQKGFTPRQEPNIAKPPSAGSNKVSTWVSKLRTTTSVDSIGAAKSALPEVEHIGPLEPDKGLAQRSNTFYSYEEMEEEQPVKETKKSCSLPAWCVYVAYFLCFALSGTFIILVILYGHKFGSDVALQWLLALLFSFVFSFMCIEPLKALVLALYMSAIEKSDEDTDDVIDVEPTYDTSVERVKEMSFKPLAGFALLRAKEDGLKVKRMRIMLRQFIAYMFYLVLVMALCYSNFPYSLHLFNETIENTFTRQNLPNSNYSFQNFTRIDEFWTWSQTVLSEGLHYDELNNYTENHILLGVARVRQVRGLIETCPIIDHPLHSGISSLTDGFSCKGSLGYTEDKSHYGDYWNISQSQNLSWRYSDDSVTGSKRRSGNIYSYGGGGYLQLLGTTYNETLTILQDLQSRDWIDLRTRAVFVDFTLYCPAEDLTTVLSLMIEFPLTGSLNTTYQIQTHKMLRYIDGIVSPVMVCEILLFILIIYYAVHTIASIYSQGCTYLKNFWNWLEMVSILSAIIAVGLYIGCVISATDKFSDYFNNLYVFTNFEKVADIHTASKYLHAWLLFILMFKVVRQIRFIKVLHIYEKTMSEAFPKLMGTFLIFLILYLNHGMIAYLFYGRSLSGFENYWTSLTHILAMIRGSFNFFPLLFAEEIFTHIFLYSYMIFVYGLTVALVRAILNDTYKTVKSQMYYKSTLDMQDYEMIDFMMKRFKLWAGIDKLKPEHRQVHFEGLPSERCSTSQSHRSLSSDSGVSSELFEIYERNHLSAAERLTHTWENVLKTLNRVEFLDNREEEMIHKTQKEIDEWKFNSRVRSYESERQGILNWKETSKQNPRTTKGPHRTMTQKSLPGKSDLGPTSLQPSSSAGGSKPAPPRGRRPASDGGRVSADTSAQKPNSRERLSIYNFFKSIKPSKSAW